ncbi:MAG: YeeE/YedE family protein [Saprospiraceae bacterium]|nr:YeeE/YedE family protein [Saprospiraceae bacterium]
MLELLRQPWPWYVAGPLIGLTVPLLLWIGNKSFGISSTLRDLCAACVPAGIPFFQYNWKDRTWNLVYVAGIMLGALLSVTVLGNPEPVAIAPDTVADLQALGLTDFSGLGPSEIFSWDVLLSWRGLIFTVVGGFLVGFGTRYAGGCTSGHSIFGLSTLQWPSLVATICFMAGGFITTHLLLPLIL